MGKGDSAAPISPTTTDGVQGLHSSPRPLATTTTTLAPRLEILQNRPGSVEIAFFFSDWRSLAHITLFIRLFLGVCVGEGLEGDRRLQAVDYPSGFFVSWREVDWSGRTEW